MRWILVSLVALNLLVLGWGLFTENGDQTAVSPQPQGFAYGNLERLQLVSESELTESVTGGQGAASAVPVTAEPVKPLCELVGAFASQEVATTLVERLQAIEVKAKIKELALPAGTRYQVYLPPQSTRKAALRQLAELQSKKIDSYIIPKGELENGISLGMFSKKALADEHLAKMRTLGLKPDVNVIERTYWEIWVMLEPGESKKMSGLAWSRALEGFADIERRQNFCLDVAS
ncbi:SPOR domain-containing protein [Teredinibacter turnerae]|uniref:SPOR domain-containing protein n=1 Tax=Teredinibacter turnerae TaxID=2426 RepID=UPI0003711BDA|nr:SPOR domain-containing protein [Teredinibacter turnerae]